MTEHVEIDELDESRAAAHGDAEQLRSYAEKKWGEDGSNIKRLDPEYYGDGN